MAMIGFGGSEPVLIEYEVHRFSVPEQIIWLSGTHVEDVSVKQEGHTRPFLSVFPDDTIGAVGVQLSSLQQPVFISTAIN